MSNLERDLRELLSRRADATTTSPGDWQDLTVRMARRNKRSKRVMASALVAALLVGPVAGFAVARAVENTEAAGRVTAAGPADAGAGGSVSTNNQTVLRASANGVNVYPSLAPGQNLDQLFRRTTSDGVVIRAFITRFGSSNCQGDGWCPPPDCFPDGVITGELSTEAAVGLAAGSHYAGEAANLRLTGGGSFGASGEGAPARWTVAQAGAQVKKVRVSYEGGGRDEMGPVDGIVLLAAPADATKSGGTVEALDGNGNVLDRADASQFGGTAAAAGTRSLVILEQQSGAAVGGSGSTPTTTLVPNATGPAPVVPPAPPSGSSSSRCTPPPPSLPAPGEQPADAAAARTEIEQAFATAYNGGLGSDDAKRAVVQDGDALKPVMEQIRNGTFAQQVKDATARVTDVVFTSPTEAAVRYDILVANYTNFTDRIGRALLIDGHWKVARVTVCADISLAGANCPPA